ncbi:6-O-methylguanine DNA methyltransferase [Scheffersomyces coipomensis]|uniref:6-O-methylguanine DNA methyltransferase n=1 Tax=Scheffersomyces coipomensis TaxID=1788519 RepID=UPI00315D7D55
MMKDFKSIKGYRLNSLSAASDSILNKESKSLIDNTIHEFALLMTSDKLQPNKIKYAFIFGTSLQRKVWNHLINIPLGSVSDYSTVAKELNMPISSSRAIGNCVGSNRIAIIVPCHRVLSKSKTLNGYRYGLKIKKDLLQAELGSNYGKYVKG